MDLTLLVVLVVVGIVAVVLAVHLTGGSKRAVLADADAARARFREDFPDLRIDKVLLTADGSAALLSLAGGVGIVQAVGGKFLTRLVSAKDLAGQPRADGATIALRFHDFTWPGGGFTFASADDAKEAERMFVALRKAGIWEER